MEFLNIAREVLGRLGNQTGKSKICSSHGFAMLEVLGAIFIMSVAGGMYLSNNFMKQRDNTRVQLASTQMKTVSKAAAQFAQANASGILGSLTAGSSSGLAIPLATLEADGALQSGFNAVNPWGQTINVMYFEPIAGTIASVVYTTGGNPMESRNMVLAAKLQGAQGGYVPDATLQSTYAGQGICSGSCVQGAGNSWQFPMATMAVPTTYGHLVTYASLNNASLVQNTLYRYPVPGNANATGMGTNINMNGFTISNLPTVSSGGTCTNPNGIAVNSQGYVVTCVSGTWQNAPTSQWGSISNPTSATGQYGNGSLTLNGSLNTSGQPIYAPGRQLNNYITSPPSGCFVCNSSNTVEYVGVPGSMVIWAQPCNTYNGSTQCGPWSWYGAGSYVVNGYDFMNGNNSVAWWNTSYGTQGYCGDIHSIPTCQGVLY